MLQNKTKDYLFVSVQLMLFMLYGFGYFKVFTSSFPKFIHLLGMVLAFIGILLILWSIILLNKHLTPFPSPAPSGKLINHGPYRCIRHPIYTGILALGFGMAIYLGDFGKLFIMVFLGLLFYFKSVYEEKLLVHKFLEYTGYIKRTGRFLPKL
ncbi:MAG: isoprenylcysteine carboxylmethyltransferase family protein [Flavobacteriaceae bacterium]|nr:isoprenylcysteine carboxylmethyltransferase family protein [Flavobacteriaceae bacterium]